MDQGFGLEHVLWFADGPEDAHEVPTFERNRSHDYVAREITAVREAVGSRAKVLAGVNLPMLVRAICYRSEKLDQLATKALAGGSQSFLPYTTFSVTPSTPFSPSPPPPPPLFPCAPNEPS